LVLEAGLGGEFDATTAFEKDLLLVAPIDIDHADILGDTLQKIATTKLRAINSTTVLSAQSGEVINIAKAVANKRNCKLFFADVIIDQDEKEIFKARCRKLGLAPFFAQNLTLAVAGAKILSFDISQKNLPKNKLNGRFEQLARNIIIDVGHNPACATAIKSELKNKKVQLVYNSMKDKDFESVLLILKQNIEEVEIIDLDSGRALQRATLERFLDKNSIKYRSFSTVDSKKEYLVFGSFLVVQKFMENYHG
jgi:dihydrofolate synthase/folylpolyglutamate synthase